MSKDLKIKILTEKLEKITGKTVFLKETGRDLEMKLPLESSKVKKLRAQLSVDVKKGMSSALNYMRLAYALLEMNEPLFKDRVAGGFRIKVSKNWEQEEKETTIKFLRSNGIPCWINSSRMIVIGETTKPESPLRWANFD